MLSTFKGWFFMIIWQTTNGKLVTTQIEILNQPYENKTKFQIIIRKIKYWFLFVTDKYSSLIIVNKQIKLVSFPKEWEDTRRCIFYWQCLNRTCPHSVLGWGLILWIMILRNVPRGVPVPPGLSGLLVQKKVIVSTYFIVHYYRNSLDRKNYPLQTIHFPKSNE